MNKNEQMIETLERSGVFKEYEEAFTGVTGLPVTLRPMETWQLPLHGKRNENGFCALMARQSGACAACLRAQEKLAEAAATAPATTVCAFGLRESAAPVRVGGETIGLLQTGQVLDRRPAEAAFRRTVEKARAIGVEIDNDEARKAWFATPVVPQKKMNAIKSLLAIFADQLAVQSNQIAVRQANSEPPVIAKARQFIEEHHAEELSLGAVAKAVHTSLFYFCKLFKKSTGINFTEYVSRTRVEKAKNLLLNPNLRVSEIAYQVGFQSLTHFNRVFKQVAGDSPTRYRSYLPAA